MKPVCNFSDRSHLTALHAKASAAAHSLHCSLSFPSYPSIHRAAQAAAETSAALYWWLDFHHEICPFYWHLHSVIFHPLFIHLKIYLAGLLQCWGFFKFFFFYEVWLVILSTTYGKSQYITSADNHLCSRVHHVLQRAPIKKKQGKPCCCKSHTDYSAIYYVHPKVNSVIKSKLNLPDKDNEWAFWASLETASLSSFTILSVFWKCKIILSESY